ncbi:MAG TPA: hypothetical protein VF875_18605 [Anaeromyxobacter sp.]
MRLPRAGLLAALFVASPARAEPVLALRLAVAPGLGSAAGNLPMSDAVPLQFPLQLDALWREGRLAGGLYGSWGPGQAGGCGGLRCSATVWRVGAEATWAFDAPGLEPWAGLAVGWEWARASTMDGGTITTTFGGPEVAAQGGVEWRLLRWLALGPYALLGVGRYGSYGVETPAGSASGEIADRAFHYWLHFGVRGTFTPWSTPAPPSTPSKSPPKPSRPGTLDI